MLAVWHFDAKFDNGEGHEMANVRKATGHTIAPMISLVTNCMLSI